MIEMVTKEDLWAEWEKLTDKQKLRWFDWNFGELAGDIVRKDWETEWFRESIDKVKEVD